MGRFEGKRVLITGATSGIGLAGAKRIADEGGELILTGTNPERLDRLRAAVPGATVVSNDAGSAETGAELAAVVGRAGLDGLWLNAGYAAVAGVEEIDAAFFDRMMNANVRGPVLQLAALSARLNEGASVVATSSTAAYEGAAMATVYAATKAALVATVRGWARALGPRHIRANTLVPGPIDTSFRDFMSPEVRDAFEADVVGRVPLARPGSAEEAAAVGLFLLSDEASFVTGAQYSADGGLTMQ